MSNIVTQDQNDLVRVLQSSLYPGARVDSVVMVLEYCKAAGLDPLQKPVHIVPLYDSKAQCMRDVVMPSVGLYRTQASRTGQFAGMTEPEFGPDVTKSLGGQEITFPEWCRVTVRRVLPSGVVAEFTAREYWVENYAVKGGKEKSIAPNAMWMRRPRGQIAKCASAQALRIGFPELGSAPTADEMEGKSIDPNVIEHHAAQQTTEPSEAMKSAALAAANGGTASYAAWWKSASKDDRKAMASHHERLKAHAAMADAQNAAADPAGWIEKIDNAADKESASALLDQAMEAVGADNMGPINEAFERAWAE